MSKHVSLLLLTLVFALPGMATAQDHSGHAGHSTATPASSTAPAAATQPLSEGEVLRWDASAQKITLRHGELQNLGMPPMTMVFRVPDAHLARDLQAGDKVRFRAENVRGSYHVIHIEKAH